MTEFNSESANWKDLSVVGIFNTAVETSKKEPLLINSGGWWWEGRWGPLTSHLQAFQVYSLASGNLSSGWPSRRGSPIAVHHSLPAVKLSPLRCPLCPWRDRLAYLFPWHVTTPRVASACGKFWGLFKWFRSRAHVVASGTLSVVGGNFPPACGVNLPSSLVV